MKMKKNILLLGLSLMGFSISIGNLYADVYKGKINAPKPSYTNHARLINDCPQPTAQIDLDINNVRAQLMNGGDMWWDIFGTTDARYEVPKVEPGFRSVHSSFASALWFGGVDQGGQLKTAGVTYRQGGAGTEFWPGPLDTVTANTSASECALWDQQYSVLQSDILAMKNGEQPTSSILSWPGNGDINKGHTQFLAPFVDVDGDGVYEPSSGDYPTLDPSTPEAQPDQMIWWVYNDKGNVHRKFIGGEPIGLEVHALAFAFRTSNEINNMTFYKYKVFNRSSTPLYQTYFSVFTDSDLGNPNDDYAGCDMAMVDNDGAGPRPAKPRSFGYTYNADATDEDGVALGYGDTPPVFGIDYFKGPKDENGVELPMSTFMFFTNQGEAGVDGDPTNAIELYRYLSGFWANGQPLVYGGNGRTSGGERCYYAFPGTTDPGPNNNRPEWTEVTAGMEAGDRRLVQSSGPFTLNPGAVNEVIIGAVWARASSGNQLASIPLAIAADDKAQILFDNNFKLANGPAAVTLNAIPQDKKIVLALENTQACERYKANELDNEDLNLREYKFQGYKIYQYKDETVGVSDLDNPSKAVLIYQMDIKDGIDKVVNKFFDQATGNVNAKVMVEGANQGIKHTIEVTQDAFALGADNSIVNNKRYFYAAIPYAVTDVDTAKTKYLASRSSGSAVAVVANKPTIKGLPNTTWMSSVPVARVEGAGNGGLVLDLSPESENAILQNISGTQVTYTSGKNPVNIKVYDATKIPNMNFKIVFNSTLNGYTLYNADNNQVLMKSDSTYDGANTLNGNEQLAEIRTINSNTGSIVKRTPLGFSITIDNMSFYNPGEQPAVNNNGFLEATVEYGDPAKAWLEGINGSVANGWIQGDAAIDPEAVYSNILGGTIAPYKMARFSASNSPLLDNNSKNNNNSPFEKQSSVDLVLTSDTTKWSRCIVVESGGASGGEVTESAPGENAPQKRLNLRGGNIGYGVGRGRFPGYAINIETGERLNVFFAEASHLPDENGRDMLFNPTSTTTGNIMGGRHYIYVSRSKYDSCNAMWNTMTNNGTNYNSPVLAQLRALYGNTDWVSIPILKQGEQLLGTDIKVRIRVTKPYVNYVVPGGTNGGNPVYTFNTKEVIVPYSSDQSVANKNALDLINVVPNPYYASSLYELNSNEFRVRFTNLPQKATISIYTASGILVRKFSKSDPTVNYIDWDLQNAKNIPIASGTYLIHINAPGVGEKTLKWFGVMRPLDFENF